jgi:hypothetical protein
MSDGTAERFADIEARLFPLEEEIRRKALLCSVNLNDETQLMALLRHHYEQCADPKSPVCDELRGLLVLRYQMEKNCSEAIGGEHCEEVLADIAAHLARLGFSTPS